MHSGPHSPTYDRIMGWLAEIIRAAGAHADMGLRLRVDELERQLRDEVTASGAVLVSPLVVGAWCRLP